MSHSPNFPYKWPRHYAAEIIATPTRDKRHALLAAVPEEWRAWVEDLVSSHFAKARALRLYRQRNPA